MSINQILEAALGVLFPVWSLRGECKELSGMVMINHMYFLIYVHKLI